MDEISITFKTLISSILIKCWNDIPDPMERTMFCLSMFNNIERVIRDEYKDSFEYELDKIIQKVEENQKKDIHTIMNELGWND